MVKKGDYLKKEKVDVKSSTPWFVVVLVVVPVIGYLVASPYARWTRYESTNLAPYGGGLVKDMAAFMLTSLPGIARMFKSEPSAKAMEGFHDELQFNSLGQGLRKLKDSPHFAENFYFWGNSPGRVDFLYTIRMSFYGQNASHIIPWFHFKMDGETYDLPEDFEEKVPPHKSGEPMVASCVHGTLELVCVEPFKLWKIKYKGTVRNVDTGATRQVQAEFSLYFSDKNVFKYQIHWDELTAARAMAGKEWTLSFWENIRAQNQERYMSQADKVTGFIAFMKKNEPNVEESRKDLVLDGSRDHNFGIRNWKFIWRYIWWPGVKFLQPLEIEGIKYTYFTGALTEYGNTFKDMVVGGLMSDNGDCASFSASSRMEEVAPEWYRIESSRGNPIGDKTLGKEFNMQIAILHGRYVLDINIIRGKEAGLWQHHFMLADGDFEIHEGQSKYTFKLRKVGTSQVLQTSTAIGLFEFGATLDKIPDYLS